MPFARQIRLSTLVILICCGLQAAEKPSGGGSVSRWRTHIANGEKALARHQSDEALRHFQAALQEAEGFDDRNAHRLIESLDRLALICLDDQSPDNAEPFIRRRQELTQKHYPREDGRKAAGLYLEGLLCAQKGDLERGEQLIRDFEKLASMRAGAFSVEVALCRARLGDAYLKNNKFAEAEALYKKAIKTFTTPQTRMRWQMKFEGTSEVVLQKQITVFEDLLGGRNIGLVGLLEERAAVLRRLGHHADADAAASRASSIHAVPARK